MFFVEKAMYFKSDFSSLNDVFSEEQFNLSGFLYSPTVNCENWTKSVVLKEGL